MPLFICWASPGSTCGRLGGNTALLLAVPADDPLSAAQLVPVKDMFSQALGIPSEQMRRDPRKLQDAYELLLALLCR